MSTERKEPNYNAPALEKGLDILELLAEESQGLSQKMVASKLDRTAAEIFRMLMCLEKRGYISRSTEDDLYRLTPRLLELGHRHPPTQQLLEHAAPKMRSFAMKNNESCHLGILNKDQVQIIAQEDCPGYVGFAVRVGRSMPADASSSGAVLLAFQENTESPIRRAGYGQTTSNFFDGISDISCPIFDVLGNIIAVLTCPYAENRKKALPIEEVRSSLLETSNQLSAAMGYHG